MHKPSLHRVLAVSALTIACLVPAQAASAASSGFGSCTVTYTVKGNTAHYGFRTFFIPRKGRGEWNVQSSNLWQWTPDKVTYRSSTTSISKPKLRKPVVRIYGTMGGKTCIPFKAFGWFDPS